MKAKISFSDRDHERRPHTVTIELDPEPTDDPELIRELRAPWKRPVRLDVSLSIASALRGFISITTKTFKM